MGKVHDKRMKEFLNHTNPKKRIKIKNLTTDHTDHTDKGQEFKAKVRVVRGLNL
jgi:stress-induced morphogen